MKIVFNSRDKGSKIYLSKKSSEEILISLEFEDNIGEEVYSHDITFKKETLKDFIGALLHLQSKLNK
jgi:hypothetical protein